MFTKKLLGMTFGSWEASAALNAARNVELCAASDLDHARTLLSSRTILVGIIELGTAVPAEVVELFLREHWWVTWVAVCRSEALQDARWRRLIHEHCIDYHTLPVVPARFGHTLGHAYGFAALADTTLVDNAPRLAGTNGMKITGNSPAIAALRQRSLKAASAEAPVLIWGESGTGKELVARAVHENSARRGGAFVPINCGAIPAGLIQS